MGDRDSSNNNSQSDLKLNEKLVHINKKLCEEEVARLKFLLKDSLPKTKLAKDIRALELFNVLFEKLLIRENDQELLVECLVLLNREDLAEEYFPYLDRAVRSSKIPPFRIQLFHIGYGLEEPDLKDLMHLFKGIPKYEEKKIVTPYDLFTSLEEKTIICADNTDRLQKALRTIGKDKLADDLNNFHRGVPQYATSVPVTSSDSMTSMSSFSDKEMMSNLTRLKAEDAYLWADASLSVGKVGGGTGFRVGSKYIMTASHVLKLAFGIEENTPVTVQDIQEMLDRQGLSIHFKFASLIHNQQIIIPLLKIVFYRDKRIENLDYNLDVTIAELAHDAYNVTVPSPLCRFYDNYGCEVKKEFHFLGHDGSRDNPEIGSSITLTRKDFTPIRIKNKLSEEQLKAFNNFGLNEQRIQFQGLFKWGGSGSPGVVIRDRTVRVLCMLVHGHFETMNQPENLKVQEGLRMWCIKDILKRENVVLCDDIFQGWDTQNEDVPMSE